MHTSNQSHPAPNAQPNAAAALSSAALAAPAPAQADASASASAGASDSVPRAYMAAYESTATTATTDTPAPQPEVSAGKAKGKGFGLSFLKGPSLRALLRGKAALKKQEQAAQKEKIRHNPSLGMQKHNLLLADLRHHLIYLLLGLGGITMGFLSLAGFIASSMRSSVVPYVVTVDTHGVVLNEGKLSPLSSNEDLPASVITAQLCDFVRHVRLITKDYDIQHQAVMQAYAFVKEGSELSSELSEYYRSHNPFTLAQKQTVTVEIANVINVGEHTLQIDWVEHLKSADPLLSRFDPTERKMRALLTYSIEDTVQDTKSILLNPLNIYVHTFIVTDVIA